MQQVAIEKLSALHFFYRASNDCNTCNSSDQRMLALHLFSEIVDLFFFIQKLCHDDKKSFKPISTMDVHVLNKALFITF